MDSFRDRVAVITGAGSGIGRALAESLVRAGAHVALVDVHDERLRDVQDQLERDSDRRVSCHRADVSDRARMAALPQEVLGEHGRVDILINNAGVTVAAEFAELDLADLDWLVGVNFWGVVHGCKFFLPALRESDDAYIVNLSSLFGLVGVPGQSGYCATKFAVRGFSESLAAELAHSRVRVLSVHPGGIATNIVRDGRFVASHAHRQGRLVSFFERHAMPAERCAEIILGAMRRGRSRVLVTRETHVADALKRIFPTLSQAAIARAGKLLARRS
jgi:short-subunit dehydrogenase